MGLAGSHYTAVTGSKKNEASVDASMLVWYERTHTQPTTQAKQRNISKNA